MDVPSALLPIPSAKSRLNPKIISVHDAEHVAESFYSMNEYAGIPIIHRANQRVDVYT